MSGGKSKRERKIEFFQNGQRRCSYCCAQLHWSKDSHKKRDATLDRLIPGSAGGTYHKENLLVVCAECNSKRGDTSILKFLEKHQPPKKEWLLMKYHRALKFYLYDKQAKQVMSKKKEKTFKRLLEELNEH